MLSDDSVDPFLRHCSSSRQCSSRIPPRLSALRMIGSEPIQASHLFTADLTGHFGHPIHASSKRHKIATITQGKSSLLCHRMYLSPVILVSRLREDNPKPLGAVEHDALEVVGEFAHR